ncbi:MAG: hypothetical protein PHE78_01010 [Candidatus Gastranaerophilales bacterium]|nr:hypothetical protein [Candidatus Gastranaerophilales bacterium]
MEEKDLEHTLADGLGLKLVEALQNQTDEDGDFIEEPITFKEEKVEIKTPEPKPVFSAQSSDDLTLSDNVTKLIKLVNTLPADVSKQTGAIIIKQTMEAMGISMKDLISEAKGVQESINGNIRTCMSDIEESKAKIKKFESQIKSYKKTSAELDDLVGLFIVTEKK